LIFKLLGAVFNWHRNGLTAVVPNKKLTMPEELYSLRLVKTLSRGNNEIIRKLIDVFAEQTPQSIEVIKAAFKSKDHNIIQSVAHKIKPTFGYFEIKETEKQIEVVEMLASMNELSPEMEEMIRRIEKTLAEVIAEMKADLN
jgi:HPt (histidine-containing phosphotransfer) domain-containing protein